MPNMITTNHAITSRIKFGFSKSSLAEQYLRCLNAAFIYSFFKVLLRIGRMVSSVNVSKQLGTSLSNWAVACVAGACK